MINLQEKRTRLALIIASAVLVTLFVCGTCGWDILVAAQVGNLERCVYPPHSCQQP